MIEFVPTFIDMSELEEPVSDVFLAEHIDCIEDHARLEVQPSGLIAVHEFVEDDDDLSVGMYL